VPLLTFTLSLRRLPLLMLSFLQFLSPTVQVVIAVMVLHEPLSPALIAAFVCIWLSVAIFIGDAAWQVRARKKTLAHESRAASDSVLVHQPAVTR
jgi:chloramphenicol-sensitive protein RarD